MPDATALPSARRLLDLIDGMAGRPVAMLVDLVADRFITGVPKRISREAPVLILAFEEERLVAGGGANAVANVAALGGAPLPLGVVGDDDSGRALLSALTEMGVPVDGIAVRAGYRTPTKTRILGGGRHAIKQQIVRYDVEDHLELGEAERQRFAQVLAERGAGARVAVVSDYGYGAAVPEALPLLRQALGEEATLLCDSRYRLGEYGAGRGLDGATPNEEEAEALLGRPLGEQPDELAASGRELLDRLSSRYLLITRGSRGMSLFEGAGGADTASAPRRPTGAWHLPVHGTDQVADVTGAGDTVIGTFALALAAGATPLEATLLANYAGGVVVMKVGTATVSPAELRQAVRDDPLPRQEARWAAW